MNINRRAFLFGSAAATTFAGCLTSTARKGLRPLAAGEKRTVALIGYGKQMASALLPQLLGKHGAQGAEKLVKVVAVCDCDKDRRLAGAAAVDKAYRQKGVCRAVADFRDIMKDDAIDAVVIATPDHWHAYLCVEAMKHGKDVYCEKPLTFSPDESMKVMEAQEKYGRVFQTGSMQRSWDIFRTACMVVRNGGIGDVKYVDANFGKFGQKLGGPSHPVRFFDEPERAANEGAPNKSCDWQMWLGPARQRPYSDQLAPRGMHKFYPMFWRFDDDIATGYCGDWGAHHLDIAQWGLDLDESGPYRCVRSEEPYSGNPFHGGRRQFGSKLLFKTKSGDVELYHGPFSQNGGNAHGWGTVFYGTTGIVAVARGKIAVWKGTGLVKPTTAIRKAIEDCSYCPELIVASTIGKEYGTDALVKKDASLDKALAKLKEFFKLETAPVQLYKSKNQILNFCECIETRAATISPSNVGARGAVLCQLLNMSYMYDTGFDWDPAEMKFANGTGDPSWLKRANCRGWDIVV